MPRTTAVLLLSCLATCPLALADDLAEGRYAALAEEAKAAFQPITPEQIESARSEAASALAAVDALIRPGTPLGAGWSDYLALDGLREQLSAGAEFDATAPRATLSKLGSGAAGLERAPFGALADALDSYVALGSFAGVKDQTALFGRQADRLAALLDDPARLSTSRGSYQAERRLRLLAELGQADGMVAAVHDDFGHANVVLDARSSLLERLVARDVNEQSPVTDCILGTSIRGTGSTTGRLSVATLDSADSARLRLSLTGYTRSWTRGVNGPVTIRSTGDTHFSASKEVHLNNDAFHTSPAYASATTRTQTQSVKKTGGGIGSGIIEKIGRKRVAEKRHQADAIAGSHAEDRIARRLDEQLNERIAEARNDYEDRLRKPLLQRRATPRHTSFASSPEAITVSTVQASESSLAAPSNPPAVADSPLSVRLHETAIHRLAASYLDGATLTRKSETEAAKLDIILPKWVKEREPEPAPEGAEFRPYSLRFRTGRPISVEFDENLIVATIHAARIQVGEENYDGWDLILRFRPEAVDGAWKLVRIAEVEVLPTSFDPAAGRPMASKRVALRNNLAKALNEPDDRLPREVEIDPIDLSDRDAAINSLVVDTLSVADGWLTIGWEAL